MLNDIVFIHFSREGSFSFTRKHYPRAHVASQDCKKAAVAILLSGSDPLQISESILDPNDRFIIPRGTLQGHPIALCNIYVPNTSQIQFIWRILLKLSDFPSSALILGGDLNAAFSEVKDRPLLRGKTPNASQSRCQYSFWRLIRKFALYDFWRMVHPSERTYSLFSPPHHSHSHIDYFFGNTPALRMMASADLGTIMWSWSYPNHSYSGD